MKNFQNKNERMLLNQKLLVNKASLILNTKDHSNIFSTQASYLSEIIPSSDTPQFSRETKDIIKQILKKNVNKPSTKALLDKIVTSQSVIKTQKDIVQSNKVRKKSKTHQNSSKDLLSVQDDENFSVQDENKQQNYYNPSLINLDPLKRASEANTRLVIQSQNQNQTFVSSYNQNLSSLGQFTYEPQIISKNSMNNNYSQQNSIHSNLVSQSNKIEQMLSSKQNSSVIQQFSYKPNKKTSYEIFKSQANPDTFIKNYGQGAQSEQTLPSLISQKKDLNNRNQQKNTIKLEENLQQQQQQFSTYSQKNYQQFNICNSQNRIKIRQKQLSQFSIVDDKTNNRNEQSQFMIKGHGQKYNLISRSRPDSVNYEKEVSDRKQPSSIKTKVVNLLQGEKVQAIIESQQTPIMSKNNKMSKIQQIQNDYTPIGPQKDNNLSAYGINQLKTRPGTDAKKRRNINGNKHIIIRDTSSKEQNIHAISQTTNAKNNIQQSASQESDGEKKGSIYMFTFNNGDNPVANLAKKSFQAIDDLNPQFIDQLRPKNQREDRNMKQEVRQSGSFLGQSNHSRQPSFEQDTFALSNSQNHEVQESREFNGKLFSPNFSNNKPKVEQTEGGPSDFWTIKDYFDQDMGKIVKFNRMQLQNNSLVFNQIQQAETQVQNSQSQNEMINNDFQQSNFLGYTPLITKRPFSMCNQQRKTKSSQKPRPISCAISKNSFLPACFLEDPSNFSSEKNTKRQSSAQLQLRPPSIPKPSQILERNENLAQGSISRNKPLQHQVKSAIISQHGSINDEGFEQIYPIKNGEKFNMMSSFEGNINYGGIPPIPKIPQRRIQSSNQQYRKPVVSKKFMQKMVSNQNVSINEDNGTFQNNNESQMIIQNFDKQNDPVAKETINNYGNLQNNINQDLYWNYSQVKDLRIIQ
ncbi:UNKNOWN [Stylonychia lemnae]|uniref:Uncharacterized protein n=1 Tax=Stylonychia lemnae TaxID=5949 RepID=A0A077ZTW9_STYLE|nr:UNKNOWN [Stylonychia lemnae]|eukprot:CDW73338.1 UNKNOWN [Stylonychia lemnae]